MVLATIRGRCGCSHPQWTVSTVPQCSHRYAKKPRLSSLQESAQQRRRQHFVGFFDLDVSEVAFLREAECPPVVVILENVSDSEKGVGKDAEEKCDEVYFG